MPWQKRLLTVISIVGVCLLSLQPYTVVALSPEQKKAQDSGVRYFNIHQAPVGLCGGDANLTGSDNPEKVWNFLTGKGLTTIQAAGAMGNLQFEGAFNPRTVERGWGFPKEMDAMPPNVGPQGQPGYGLVQWTSPGRKSGLVNLAGSKNLPVHDLGLQLEYMWSELEGPYKSAALDPLRQATDLATAVAIWQNKYEVGKFFAPRLKAAEQWLGRFGSNATTPTNTSGSVTCGDEGSGQITGGFSLPVDRKWYDQNPTWFTKPHHDYPSADIPVPTGTNIYAVSAGRVIKAPTGGACGVGLIIDAGNGVVFTYCHGSDGGAVPGAKQGDEVKAGQLIMHSASTGRSSGPHLHLQIAVNSQNRCPQSLLTGIASGSPPAIPSLPSSGCTY